MKREEEVLKFTKCMREHGVDIHASVSGEGIQVTAHASAPEGGGPNENPAFQAAQNACQGYMAKFGPPGGHGPGGLTSGRDKGGSGGLSLQSTGG